MLPGNNNCKMSTFLTPSPGMPLLRPVSLNLSPTRRDFPTENQWYGTSERVGSCGLMSRGDMWAGTEGGKKGGG